MTHPRTDLRNAVKAALRLVPALAGYNEFAAWAQPTDKKRLPGWAVAIPRESSRRDAVGDAVWRPEIVVIVKRLGGDDLDDMLDDLSALIEAAVGPVLQVECAGPSGLDETLVQIEGGGDNRIGTLIMRFGAERYGAVGQPETP